MTVVPYAVNPRGTTYDAKIAGDITVTAGGVAEFENPQTGNIGEGYKVIYNLITSYILEMTDSTHAKLVTALGVPASNQIATPLTSIQAEYASRAAAFAGMTDANHLNSTDWVSDTFEPILSTYYDDDDGTVDSGYVDLTGVTTDATYFLTIRSPSGGTQSINNQRSTTGILDTAKSIHQLSKDGNTGIIRSRLTGTLLQGQQLVNTTATTAQPVIAQNAANASCTVEQSILVAPDDGRGIRVSATTGNFDANNCIIYQDGTTQTFNSGVSCESSTATVTLQYCMVANFARGLTQSAGTFVDTNCIILDVIASRDHTGTFTTNNCTGVDGDGTAAITLDNGSYAYTNIWEDWDGTPPNFNPANDTSDTNAPQNKATPISIDTDFFGNDRDDTNPDGGPIEFVSIVSKTYALKKNNNGSGVLVYLKKNNAGSGDDPV
ncbi:hypothetical protein KAR91_73570, partial [Candidatus Pacearchaeota archaeon]|nr:hypothetical protein [Candidatus Pacearchaeota archaeon]